MKETPKFLAGVLMFRNNYGFVSSRMWRVVNDVRTFFCEHPEEGIPRLPVPEGRLLGEPDMLEAA